jgi:hypothetical protein
MSFHLAATFACIVLELSSRRVESIPNGNIHVLVSMMLIRAATYDQFTIRRRDIYSYMEEIAFVVMMVRRLHDNLATHNIVTEPLDLFRPFANILFDGC